MTEWEFLAVLESCAIGIFFLDSMKTEDLTLPKFLAFSSVCSSLLYIVGAFLAPPTLQFFLHCYAVTSFYFSQAGFAPFHTCFVSVTYSWYTIEVCSRGSLSLSRGTQLEYFLGLLCLCSSCDSLEDHKTFCVFPLKHIQALIIAN